MRRILWRDTFLQIMKKATISLIMANIFAYGALAYLSGSLQLDRYYIDIYGLSRDVFFKQHYYWQPLSSFFLHFNLSHLIYNLLFLAVFGYLAEDIYGWRKTFLIYLTSGLLVSFSAITFYPRAVFGGASGAVLGLVGAVAAQQKNRNPLVILAFAVFLFLVISEVYLAHLTGFASGFLIPLIFFKDNGS